MAFVIADRVRETTTTIGTGSITLAGAYTSFQSFSAAIGNGNNTYYTIASASSGEWEVGIGTYSSGGNLLSRDTVLSSSNAGSLVNFSVGSKDVFVTQPSERSLLINAASNGLFAGNAAFTANGVPYANSTSTLTTGSALTFDGTNIDLATVGAKVNFATTSSATRNYVGGAADGFSLEMVTQRGALQPLSYKQNFSAGHEWGIAGSGAMTLTSTGLGIGTSSTTGYRLNVVAAFTTGVGGAYVEAGEFNKPILVHNHTNGSVSANLFQVQKSGSGVLTLDSSGNLGIGTSSPAYKLDVNGDAQIGNATAGTNRTLRINGVVNKASRIAFQESGTDRWLIGNGAASENGNFEIYDATNGNNFVLTRTGNLGLGVTPSAWDTSVKVMEFPSSSLAVYNGGITHNAFFDSVNSRWEYRNASSNPATFLNMQGGAFAFNIAGNGTQNNPISFTQAMTLDASGNLGIGTTSPGAKLDVTNGASPQSRLRVGVGAGAANTLYSTLAAGDYVSFETNGTERARITSGGYFKASNDGTYVGSTASYHELRVTGAAGDWNTVVANATATAANAFGIRVAYTGSAPNGTGNAFLSCDDTGATRFVARSNGGLANYSANDVNLSDRREKTNFAPAKSYLDTICAIPVQTFNYIDQSEDDPGLTLGVVAQDVQAVAPELVMESNWGTEDNPKMRLSIYQTDLQYALMKALQELKAEFDAYKATHP